MHCPQLARLFKAEQCLAKYEIKTKANYKGKFTVCK